MFFILIHITINYTGMIVMYENRKSIQVILMPIFSAFEPLDTIWSLLEVSVQ